MFTCKPIRDTHLQSQLLKIYNFGTEYLKLGKEEAENPK